MVMLNYFDTKFKFKFKIKFRFKFNFKFKFKFALNLWPKLGFLYSYFTFRFHLDLGLETHFAGAMTFAFRAGTIPPVCPPSLGGPSLSWW